MFRWLLMGAVCAASVSVQAAAVDRQDLLELFRKYGVVPLDRSTEVKESSEMVELGHVLFFDKILSGNKDIACATCHFQAAGTSDLLPLPVGTGGFGIGEKRELRKGHIIPRNAPPAFNMGFKSFHTTMWDGRIAVNFETNHAQTPEPRLNGAIDPADVDAMAIKAQLNSVAAAQALFPVTSRHEMRGAEGENEVADAEDNFAVWKALTARLVGTENGSQGGIEKYKEMFKAAYPNVKNFDEFNFGHVARAIAAFEITRFRADESDFDKFIAGELKALTHRQFKGAEVFAKGGKCIECHSGPQLSDFKFHAAGMPQLGPGKEADKVGADGIGEDLGLALITGNEEDNYKFKTVPLRNSAINGPWSHAGAFTDLRRFLAFHADPASALGDYLQNTSEYFNPKSPVDFVSLIDHDEQKNAQRLKYLNPIFREIQVSSRDLDNLELFLKAMVDKSYLGQVRVPKSVPSGIPVLDKE